MDVSHNKIKILIFSVIAGNKFKISYLFCFNIWKSNIVVSQKKIIIYTPCKELDSELVDFSDAAIGLVDLSSSFPGVKSRRTSNNQI